MNVTGKNSEADNLLKILSFVFSEKKKKSMSKCHLLQLQLVL